MPPQGQNEQDPLQRDEQRLYSPTSSTDFRIPSLSVNQNAPQPLQSWQRPPPKPPKKPVSIAVWFFFGALAFFVVAACVATAFVLLGARLVSNNNITMTVQGPAGISSGTAVPLTVTITNHNPAAISNTDISLDFPDGTRSADDITQPLVRYTDTFGTIPAGATVTRTVNAVLFGSANQSVTIPVTFEYHTANSDALFTKQQNYTFTITSAPLTLTVSSPSTAASGQPLSIAIAVRSNATTPLSNVAIVAEFPFGFVPKKATTGTTTSSFISVGTLAPGEEKDITVQGTLSGSDNTQSAFQFTVGTATTDGSLTLAVPYATQQTQVTISKPFLAVSLDLDNSDDNPVIVPAGEPISGIVSWMNSLTSAITNGQVSVAFSGDALDPASVTTTDGFYSSSKGTITYNSQSQPDLASLSPNDSGNGSFTFSTKTGTALDTLRNPTIQLAVSVSGQHSGTASVDTINNTLMQTVEISTDLELNSLLTHTGGSFGNSGPLPPTANQTTTYTVLWSVTNTVNDVAAGTVTAILPTYVNFTGKLSPTDGSLSYNATTRTVTWKIGDIPAGTLSKPLQASFQLAFEPSISQVGTSPILIGNQTLTGQDRFTNTVVGNTAPALSIQTTTDTGYQPTFGNVAN